MQEHLGPCDPGGLEALMRLRGSSVYLSREAFDSVPLCLLWRPTLLFALQGNRVD